MEKFLDEKKRLRNRNGNVIGQRLIAERNKSMGPNISVFYKQEGGVVISEGKGVFMVDVDGNEYLDCCNNVACVGHSHPKVIEAGL